MKRINCRPLAVEAVLTRHGTLVGPLMSDITGHPELTPYKGGWAGNDVYLDVLDETQRRAPGSSPRTSATGWPTRATAASSRWTTWSTSIPASSTWVS